jgi:hypothetical protein
VPERSGSSHARSAARSRITGTRSTTGATSPFADVVMIVHGWTISPRSQCRVKRFRARRTRPGVPLVEQTMIIDPYRWLRVTALARLATLA